MIRPGSYRPSIRLATLVALAVTGAVVGSGATFALQSKQRKPPTTRTSTDPIIPGQGKLGQDLFLAIDHGDLAGVKKLLAQGADPNARDGLTITPLYLAAATAQTEAMDALIKAGAKIEAPSPYGSPLCFAGLSGAVPGIQFLLSKGANVNATRADGACPLLLCARAGADPGVKMLLASKADANAKDVDGLTPLMGAAQGGHLDVGRTLISAGANVNATDSHGWTPLAFSAAAGRVEFAKLLLEKGAKANTGDEFGRTPLMLATAYSDSPETVAALLKSGANAGAKDSKGRTALALATARGRSECAAALGGPNAASTASGRSAKEAAAASLKALERSMLVFNKKTGCVSCHQEGLGRIATGVARERGFSTDPAVDRVQIERLNGVLKETAQLHTMALKDPEVMKQVPLIEIEEVTTAYAFLLAGMAARKQPPTPEAGAMAMVLARQQTPEGNWRFSLPRVPMQSSFVTFTTLAIQSLKAYAPKAGAAEVAQRINRAKTWLWAAPTPTSEDRSMRLLGLKWAGGNDDDKTEWSKAIADLKSEQRPDGGWPQLPNMKSDAYATGQALYALHVGAGVPVTDPVYQRGVRYLLRTQDEDGSWFVNKRAMPANNYFDAGFPHGESQYSSFNGTCWAMMALLQTVGQSKQSASR